MIRRAWLAVVCVLAGAVPATASDVEILRDVDNTLYLFNTTASPVSLTGYGIRSADIDINFNTWQSFAGWTATDPNAVTQSLGALAIGFSESAATTSLIAEKTLTGVATIQPYAKVSIGRPLSIEGYFSFATTAYFTVPGSTTEQYLHINRIPEPSTWLLGTLAGVGFLFFRRRPASSLRPL